jgi:hypothetical protein
MPTTGGPQDNVQITYALDRMPITRKDQRGVVLTNTYDAIRRPILQGATSLPARHRGR